jgi:hypothetical protein
MNNYSNLSVVNELEENCMRAQPSVLKSATKNYTWSFVGKPEEKRPPGESTCT